MLRRLLPLSLVALVLAWVSTCFFSVDQTETALVTRFGRPVSGISGPGLHRKMPWPIDRVLRVDQRLLVFDNEPTEMLTQDKKNVLVDSFVCWRVGDPLLFAQTVRGRAEAEARILDLSSSELGATIGSHTMGSFLNVEGKPVQFASISKEIADSMNKITESSFGIEIVDFQVNGFNLPRQNRNSVIDRMRAERTRIATSYRSQGEERALTIEAETASERERILAIARAEAESLKGTGEADALAILGKAYSEDPEFYRFLRTLESYETIIDENTTIFLESDSELLQLLRGPETRP